MICKRELLTEMLHTNAFYQHPKHWGFAVMCSPVWYIFTLWIYFI